MWHISTQGFNDLARSAHSDITQQIGLPAQNTVGTTLDTVDARQAEGGNSNTLYITWQAARLKATDSHWGPLSISWWGLSVMRWWTVPAAHYRHTLKSSTGTAAWALLSCSWVQRVYQGRTSAEIVYLVLNGHVPRCAFEEVCNKNVTLF